MKLLLKSFTNVTTLSLKSVIALKMLSTHEELVPHILSSTGVYPNRPNPKGLPSMLQDYAKSSINIKKEKPCSILILREKHPCSNWNKKRHKKDTKMGFLSQFRGVVKPQKDHHTPLVWWCAMVTSQICISAYEVWGAITEIQVSEISHTYILKLG